MQRKLFIKPFTLILAVVLTLGFGNGKADEVVAVDYLVYVGVLAHNTRKIGVYALVESGAVMALGDYGKKLGFLTKNGFCRNCKAEELILSAVVGKVACKKCGIELVVFLIAVSYCISHFKSLLHSERLRIAH